MSVAAQIGRTPPTAAKAPAVERPKAPPPADERPKAPPPKPVVATPEPPPPAPEEEPEDEVTEIELPDEEAPESGKSFRELDIALGWALNSKGLAWADLAEAADEYAATLPESFDLVLLGLGPDGHVASLFPGFAQLDERDRRVAEVFGSPKPPAERISLTFPALNATDAVWFVASGEGKAEAVARALAPEGTVHATPARGVAGRVETRWFLDPAAASLL